MSIFFSLAADIFYKLQFIFMTLDVIFFRISGG